MALQRYRLYTVRLMGIIGLVWFTGLRVYGSRFGVSDESLGLWGLEGLRKAMHGFLVICGIALVKLHEATSDAMNSIPRSPEALTGAKP